jgi:predicted enzyme related to lactoylglutathione lyase
MNRVVHFETQVTDIEKSAEFYKNLFSWQVSKWDGPESCMTILKQNNKQRAG